MKVLTIARHWRFDILSLTFFAIYTSFVGSDACFSLRAEAGTVAYETSEGEGAGPRANAKPIRRKLRLNEDSLEGAKAQESVG